MKRKHNQFEKDMKEQAEAQMDTCMHAFCLSVTQLCNYRICRCYDIPQDCQTCAATDTATQIPVLAGGRPSLVLQESAVELDTECYPPAVLRR